MVQKQTTAIIVLGMHASGTSLLSHILMELSVNMGTEFTGPVKNVPTWENVDFMKMNVKLLNAAGGNWNTPPSKAKIEVIAPQHTEQMRTIIAKNQSALWGFKDPRTALTVSTWHPLLHNPKYLYAYRNPDAVAKSILQRGPCHRNHNDWVNLVHRYNTSIQDFILRENPSWIEVSFERLVSPDYSVWEIGKIAQYVGVNDENLIHKASKVIKVRQ